MIYGKADTINGFLGRVREKPTEGDCEILIRKLTMGFV